MQQELIIRLRARLLFETPVAPGSDLLCGAQKSFK